MPWFLAWFAVKPPFPDLSRPWWNFALPFHWCFLFVLKPEIHVFSRFLIYDFKHFDSDSLRITHFVSKHWKSTSPIWGCISPRLSHMLAISQARRFFLSICQKSFWWKSFGIFIVETLLSFDSPFSQVFGFSYKYYGFAVFGIIGFTNDYYRRQMRWSIYPSFVFWMQGIASSRQSKIWACICPEFGPGTWRFWERFGACGCCDPHVVETLDKRPSSWSWSTRISKLWS